MLTTLSFLGVTLTGVYFLGLAATCLVFPRQAARFLGGFAASPFRHYGEMLLRLLAGGSLITYAPEMFAADAVRLFGWIIVITSVVLCFVPWRLHRRFADRVVPPAIRHISLIGLASLALGVLLVWAVIRGPAA